MFFHIISVIDNCASAPCLNKASCVNGVNRYSCSCAVGYTGDLCQIGRPIHAHVPTGMYAYKDIHSYIYYEVFNNTIIIVILIFIHLNTL